MPPIEINQNLAKLEQFQMDKTTLFFNDIFQTKSNVYVLVSDAQNKGTFARNCQIPTCELANCQPKWLCQNQTKNIALIGVSAPTSHPNDVMHHIVDNAQQIARTVNLAHVFGETFLLNVDSSSGSISNLQQTFQIEELDKRTNPVKVGKMCHYKGALLSEITFAYGKVFQGHDWLIDPNLGQISGAIGHAKGMTSTGRLSDLLNLAARRGLFALAKAKNINVENDVEMSISNSGFYSLIRKTHQRTESLISAHVADMKMELNEKSQPEIYIWLLENKGKI